MSEIMLSEETQSFCEIRDDYERNVERVLNHIGELCSSEHYSSVSVQCELFDSVTLKNEPLLDTRKLALSILERNKAVQSIRDMAISLLDEWTIIHNIFINVSRANIMDTLEKYTQDATHTPQLLRYIESLHLTDVLECLNTLTGVFPRINRTFVPIFNSKEFVLGFSKQELTISNITFTEPSEWLKREISQTENFELSQETQTRLFNYMVQFPTYRQLYYLEYFDSEDIIHHSYMVPNHNNSKVLLFRRFSHGNTTTIVDIQLISHWEYNTLFEENTPVLEDVKVVLTKETYEQVISRRKLTKQMMKKERIPETCCICLEKFKIGNQIHTTPCSHYYHARCLKKQMCSIGPPKCPLCRHDVREEVKK